MAIESWLMDMDGVLVHEAEAPSRGADRFLARLRELELPVPAAHQQLDLHPP